MADFLQGRGVKKLGIYGLQYIINVRDYSALAAKDFEIVDFEIQFDYARAQKSEEEIASVQAFHGHQTSRACWTSSAPTSPAGRKRN